MSKATSNVIWYEILTRDLDAALKFYRAVLGWTVRPSGTPGMDYRFLVLGDDHIGGAMQIPPAAAANGMRPAWLMYFNVADVDVTVASIVAAGGAVHMPATDIPGTGRMAMVADPQGAAFYVMTPIGERVSSSFRPNAPGHGGWHELHTTDWKSALKFYSQNFGWSTVLEMDMGPLGTYLQFNTGAGAAIGGMMNDADAPNPYWLIVFNTDDVDAALRRLKAAHGEPVRGPMQVPGGDWVVVARDPQGAVFAVVGPRKS